MDDLCSESTGYAYSRANCIMDSMNAPLPIAGSIQQLERLTDSTMTSHTNEITVEHRNANSTRPGTRPVSEVDAKVDAAGSVSLTATPLMTTSLEDNMEHEDDDTSDWSPVNYRRYTTRRLKGELRSEGCTSTDLGPLACFRCHGLGHMAKFCPSPAVCRHCGRTHKEDSQCEETPFCVACQAAGHISLAPNCPTRTCKAASSPPPKTSPATETERGEQEPPQVNSTGTPLKTWSQVMTSNRGKSNGKGEDKTERFEQVQAVSAGAWRKFKQQMENLIQQNLDAMQKQITSWIQASQGQHAQAAINPSQLGKAIKPLAPAPPKKASLITPEHTLQSKATSLPNTETQCASQNSPASLERKPPVPVDRAMDTIMQLLEKLNSRMEAIERAIEQQEQVIMQHKEVNERELAQHKATLDEYNRNWWRARNRSRD
ncbi:hypothetical protein HPB49_006140 [Dermacentor silvarum]|uniref:Uncharacterized protein n=1 Tax=Dermacentor silvarum TaxID=543639 RepID=A0ACB8CJQ8_DERSI|nr:hypothetical protein HPB49_006140 [Dermacentor silvarum]